MANPVKLLLAVVALLLGAGVATALSQATKLPISANNGPTTSAQLFSIMKDPTGTGLLVYNTAPTFGGRVSMNGAVSEKLLSTDIIDGGGVLTVDISAAPDHLIANTASITGLVLTGIDTTPGRVNSVMLYFVSTGCTTCSQAWGGSIKMPNGIPPTLSPNLGTTNPIGLTSIDGGSSWMMTIGAAY